MIKKIGIGAAVVAVAGLLAACSSSEEPPSSPSAMPSDTAPAAIDGTGVTLTIWVDENRQPAVEAAAATFEAETGAKVETVVKNFDDIRADFIAQVPTGEGPDITIGAHDWLGSLVTAGVVAPVDISAVADQFEPVSTAAFTYDGQTYGLPVRHRGGCAHRQHRPRWHRRPHHVGRHDRQGQGRQGRGQALRDQRRRHHR